MTQIPGNGAQPHGRVENFSAGPACLPIEVLEKTHGDLFNWNGAGMSVMEMSHRGKPFDSIAKKAESDLRELMNIPEDYHVIFMQGGATALFAAICLNLTQEGDTVDYVVTGAWSKKAADEAKKYCTVNVVSQSEAGSIPDPAGWQLSPGSKYVHYCANETVHGVEFKAVPEVGGRTLVADMSSNFCSAPVEVSKFGLIYAGAQKNVGPAGATVVIVRKDLVGTARAITPSVLEFGPLAKERSMLNTPPCWSIYVCGLVFEHLLARGGLQAVLEANQKKAQVLYAAIDGSNGFYKSPVALSCRSLMNAPFTIPGKPELEAAFVSEAAALGMVELKGHRSVGGMRASIYNAMPIEAVQKLADFMARFAQKHA